jgi:hypothetical protein
MCEAGAASTASAGAATTTAPAAGAGYAGYAALGAQAFGSLASAYGAYSKSSGNQSALEYQAVVADNNAKMAEWQAEDALKRGVTNVNQHQLKVSQLEGTQRASLASRGIDLGQGSALDILSDTSFMGKIDANTIQDNAAKEAWAYRTQAASASSNAALLNAQASAVNPGSDAMSSLLTGAGGVAKTWYTLSKSGAFGGSTGSTGASTVSSPYATGSFDFFNTSSAA